MKKLQKLLSLALLAVVVTACGPGDVDNALTSKVILKCIETGSCEIETPEVEAPKAKELNKQEVKELLDGANVRVVSAGEFVGLEGLTFEDLNTHTFSNGQISISKHNYENTKDGFYRETLELNFVNGKPQGSINVGISGVERVSFFGPFKVFDDGTIILSVDLENLDPNSLEKRKLFGEERFIIKLEIL